MSTKINIVNHPQNGSILIKLTLTPKPLLPDSPTIFWGKFLNDHHYTLEAMKSK